MSNQTKQINKNYVFDSLFERVVEKINTIQTLRSTLNNITSIDDLMIKKRELNKSLLEVEDEFRQSEQAMKSLHAINKNHSEQLHDYEAKLRESDKYIQKLTLKNKELNDTLNHTNIELQVLNEQNIKSLKTNDDLHCIINKLEEKNSLNRIVEGHLSSRVNNANIQDYDKVEHYYDKEVKIREIISVLLNSKDSLKLSQYLKNIFGNNVLQQLLSEDVKASFIDVLDNSIKEFDMKKENINPITNNYIEGESNNGLHKSNSNSYIKHTDAYAKNFSFQHGKYKTFGDANKIEEIMIKNRKIKQFVQYTKTHGNYFDKDYKKKFISKDLNEEDLRRTSSPLSRVSNKNDESRRISSPLSRVSNKNNESRRISSPISNVCNKNDHNTKIRSFKENTKWRSMNHFFYSQFENNNGSTFQQKSPDKITNIIKY